MNSSGQMDKEHQEVHVACDGLQKTISKMHTIRSQHPLSSLEKADM